MLQRYKITIEYDGTDYVGFQKQTDIIKKSIEEVLEKAIFQIAQEEVKIFASGRTDAGVHALGQVVHFDLQKKFKNHQIVFGLNNYLRDENVTILRCELVDQNFHARFDAKMRHYRYLLVNRPAFLALQKNRAWQIGNKLDVLAMKKAAEFLIGKHDFSSFRDAECQASSPIRSIEEIKIKKSGDQILIEISAKSFLHHMARNIVGTLVFVGLKKFTADQIKEILAARDRTKSGPNAPACGLYFLKVNY